MSEMPYAAGLGPRPRDGAPGAGWVVFGAGGHARSLVDVLERLGETVVAVVGDAGDARWHVHRLDDEDAAIERVVTEGLRAVVGIGAPEPRRALLGRLGDVVPAVVAATATVSPRAKLGAGTVVLEHAHVGPSAQLGVGVIVNTGAIVEHDCLVGEGCHVAPGAVLLGAARIGAGTFVGSGARVLPGIELGAGVTVGAGSVVTRGVPDGNTVVGVPARLATVRPAEGVHR